MRRSPIVLSATALGFAAAFGFRAHEPALPVAGTPTASAAPSASSSSSRTATGDAVETRYGYAQVRVTVSNGKITNVEALQLQGNDPKSVQISSSAEPILRQEVLSAQKAAVDAVSGATITSASYEASLQSALDKLGFKAADGSHASSEIPDVEEHDGPPGGWR